MTPESIRRIRFARAESQVDFGARLGVKQSTVAEWESGRRKPTPETVDAMNQLDPQKGKESMIYPPPLTAPEFLGKQKSVTLSRNIRALCRAHLAMLVGVGEMEDGSMRCPLCLRAAKDDADVIRNHWKCVHHRFLMRDPNMTADKLNDEDDKDWKPPV